MHTGVRTGTAQAEIRELQIRLEAAEAGNKLRDDIITDLRQQRDREAEERRQAQAQLAEMQAKLTAVLTDQRSIGHRRSLSRVARGGAGGEN